MLSAVEALRQDAGVRYAEPDWVLAADQTPNDPGLGHEWGLLNTGQTIVVNQDPTVVGTAGADIKAPAAWDVTTGATWDPVTNPAALCDPYDPARPPWHGSMVSGVIGAKGNDSTGIAGVNWRVRMMGLRWDQNWCLCGYTSQAIEAIEYAVQAKRIWDSGDSATGIAPHTQGANVRVLSNSYGCCYPVSTETGKLPYDPALLDEVRKAGDANILFVASGGNSSYDIDPPNYAHGHYPCSFDNANTFGSYDAGTGIFEPDTFEQSLGRRKTSSVWRRATTPTNARVSRTGVSIRFNSPLLARTSTRRTTLAPTASALGRRFPRRSYRALPPCSFPCTRIWTWSR